MTIEAPAVSEEQPKPTDPQFAHLEPGLARVYATLSRRYRWGLAGRRRPPQRAPAMTPVFLDTVGLIAVWERADQWHATASGVFEALLRDGVPLVTTPQVLLECGNASARRPCRADVAELRHNLIAAGGLVPPTPTEEDEAWAAL